MMTVATAVRLKKGAEQEWDTVMSERFAAARKQTGWVGGQLLHPENQDDARTMVGTWRSKEDWAKWHEDPEFAETRERLDGLTRQKPQHVWYEVVGDVRRAGSSVASALGGLQGGCLRMEGYVVGPGTGIGHPLLDGAPVGFSGLPGRHRYIVDPL